MCTPAEFPKFLVRVGDRGKSKASYRTMEEAATLLASGILPVAVDDSVLENDFSVRNITPEETTAMNQLIDDIFDRK